MNGNGWKRIPEEYLVPVEPGKGGTIRSFAYADRGLARRALVYLPRAYEEDPALRCPTVYLMHGGGGDEEEFFGGTEGRTPLKTLLDRMIEGGLIRPLIVVTPTFTRPKEEGADGPDPERVRVHAGDAAALTAVFWRELGESLIPAVDRAFRTIPDRSARAFGGFSMGAEATWSVLCRGGQYVKYYLPMSGDFWAVCVKGGKDRTEETCGALIDGIGKSGLSPEDYRIYAATGTEDIAYEAMRPMVEELLRRAPWFKSADEPEGGNLTWRVSPGWHAYDWCWDYIFRGLPAFFCGGINSTAVSAIKGV